MLVFFVLPFYFTGKAASISFPETAGPNPRGTQLKTAASPIPGHARNLRGGKYYFYRGKGTMGLILGLVLGPVGFLCVHFCSHNQTMIDMAGKGAIIWTGAALLTALVLSAVASRESVGQIALQILQGILQYSN